MYHDPLILMYSQAFKVITVRNKTDPMLWFLSGKIFLTLFNKSLLNMKRTNWLLTVKKRDNKRADMRFSGVTNVFR
ncbi:MAG: hypothetical protein WGN25_11960 [Candidatus Electrothrix sp. GW3-4]|uniref:hypothetical protein n=1 Tax=Candidatus Electrothrix sp. GW3-4 TaxID=3126740 RepID=UPI0030CF499D